MNTTDKKESFWDKCILFLSEKWNKLLSFLRENAIIIILLLLYILFYRFWETVIGEHIIDKFLCHFESNGVSDSIFIVGVLICFFLCYHNRQRRIDQKTCFLCLIAIAFWVFYRFYHRFCGFDDSTKYYLYLKPLSFTKHFKYVDFVSIYSICTLASPLLGEIINYIKEKINNNGEENVKNVMNGFIRDVPIEDSAMDELDRERIAHTAIDKLLETDTQNGAFTFGIDAPWGSGKTSFMNMMKQRLSLNNEHKHDKNLDLITIIDFNPWLFSEGKDLISTFFEVLSNNLKHYDKSLAKNIIDYSRLLSSFSTNETELIASLFDLVKHDNTLKEKKNQIESTLKRIKRRILVFIDDLDRLDAKEIMEMLKLIRNVSDFPFMYFIVAYDKSYVIQCLEAAKLSNKATDFVEKIFQVELRLLETPKTDLSNKIHNLIYEHLKDEDKNQFDWLELDIPFISSLTTLREIKRLVNSFFLSYDSLEKARPRELVFIELLKTKYPTFFSYFSNFWVSKWLNYRNDEDLIKLFITKIKEQNQKEKLKLTDTDITNIEDILKYIEESMMTSGNDKYIDSQNRDLNNYLLPTKTKITITELKRLIENNDIQTINRVIGMWMRTDHTKDSLCNALISYEPANSDNLKKLIEAIFITFSFGFTHDNLYSRITSCITKLRTFKNYNDETDWTSYEIEIKEIFIKYGKYLGTMQYLYGIAFEDNKWDYPLTRDDLNDIRRQLFEYHLNDEWNNVSDVLQCFKLLADRTIINNEKVSIYLPEQKTRMKEYAASHMDRFIPIITIRIFTMKGIFYKLDSIIKDIWGDFNVFYDSIQRIDDESYPIITEFKLLLEELSHNNFDAVQIEDPDFDEGLLIHRIHQNINNLDEE